MFLASHLFHLVLEPGQFLDCEEFWLLLKWEQGGVIGCRLSLRWILEKHTQITQDCSCFQVHLAFGNGYRVLPQEKKKDFPGD